MYMRLIQVRTKPGELSNLQSHYNDRVVSALQKTPGCLFVGLMQSSEHHDEVVSMTLWSSQSQAEDYEKSGLFRKLFDELRPMLEDSSEWKVQLSKDLTLEYAPVPTEPSVQSFSVAAEGAPVGLSPDKSDQLYLRIVSVVLKPGNLDEYRRLYADEVIPALKATKGCRHAFLMLPGGTSNEAISVTMWDDKSAAEEYESSGRFGYLVDKVKHTFTDLYQWKMKLEHSHSPGQAVTSDDMKVEGFSVLAGRNFKL